MAYETVVAPQTEIEPSGQSPRTQPKPNYLVLVVIAILLVAGAAITFVLRLGERRALAKETEVLAVPSVIVIQPKPEPPQEELVLPSSLEAYTESPIYARTNGYLAHWDKDIGSRVQKGQLLADIETPEIDQELMQARAARNQAEAQLSLAVADARTSLTLANARYTGGLVTYLDVITAQEQVLSNERLATQIQGQRLVTSVLLVKGSAEAGTVRVSPPWVLGRA